MITVIVAPGLTEAGPSNLKSLTVITTFSDPSASIPDSAEGDVVILVWEGDGEFAVAVPGDDGEFAVAVPEELACGC
ncbi:hypothetical protein GCM10027562_34280 [Arthrobacter pigmenti]